MADCQVVWIIETKEGRSSYWKNGNGRGECGRFLTRGKDDFLPTRVAVGRGPWLVVLCDFMESYLFETLCSMMRIILCVQRNVTRFTHINRVCWRVARARLNSIRSLCGYCGVSSGQVWWEVSEVSYLRKVGSLLAAVSTKSCSAMSVCPGIHIRVNWVNFEWRVWRAVSYTHLTLPTIYSV